MGEIMKRDGNHMSGTFKFISSQMGCSAVVNTLYKAKLTLRYLKENQNSAAQLYERD